ncbi:hypothetical protein LINPERPRIM_LOCUS7482 [Linum perenne]
MECCATPRGVWSELFSSNLGSCSIMRAELRVNTHSHSAPPPTLTIFSSLLVPVPSPFISAALHLFLMDSRKRGKHAKTVVNHNVYSSSSEEQQRSLSSEDNFAYHNSGPECFTVQPSPKHSPPPNTGDYVRFKQSYYDNLDNEVSSTPTLKSSADKGHDTTTTDKGKVTTAAATKKKKGDENDESSNEGKYIVVATGLAYA